MGFGTEEYADGKGRTRHGSQTFYKLLEEMAVTHDIKSHDYASDDNPAGNYHFAGKLALLFSHSEQDAGFMGRLGEKIYRLANLESSQKTPQNESIADTERDLCVIIALWISDRRDRRMRMTQATDKMREKMREGAWEGFPDIPTGSPTRGLGNQQSKNPERKS